ncbi:MAG: DUF3617 family protein [Burkholderiaceae bacterium]
MPSVRSLLLAAATLAAATTPDGAARSAQAQTAPSPGAAVSPLTPGATRPVERPGGTDFTLGHPRRRQGLWEIRSMASDQFGLPVTRYCVGDNTDNAAMHLDRAAGDKGSCKIGSFKRVGVSWVAETVCRDSRQTVISQSVASGDFRSEYRIDTLVFYSPPLPGNKREDKEAVTGRYLGACKPGQRAGDLEVPGMGTLNMTDGALRP